MPVLAMREEDEANYELIDGEDVLMCPAGTWHNTVGMNLSRIIGNYLHGKKKCRAFYETYVYLDEQNHFIPDIMIVCDRRQIKANYVEGAPALVIEILSPSTRKNDLTAKKDAYERAGVKEYWIVSPKEETIDVYLLKEGRFVLDNCYKNYSAEDLAFLRPEIREREERSLKLKVSLYDDWEVDLREVFEE